jgi:hypothetical protein
MIALLVALVLGAPADARTDISRVSGVGACSVRVLAVDPQGRLAPARAASGSLTPAMVFRGRAARASEGDPPLVFDVYNPKGQRYQVLLGTAYGHAFLLQDRPESPGPPVQATLAVASSSIAWTSMYGVWRVVPRFEGQDHPCGRAQAFTIQP